MVGEEIVGAVAIDRSVRFIAVDCSFQRHGIGSMLLERALEDLAAEGVEDAPVGSGGCAYLWPGVPSDLSGCHPLPAGAPELLRYGVRAQRSRDRAGLSHSIPHTGAPVSLISDAVDSRADELHRCTERCVPGWPPQDT